MVSYIGTVLLSRVSSLGKTFNLRGFNSTVTNILVYGAIRVGGFGNLQVHELCITNDEGTGHVVSPPVRFNESLHVCAARADCHPETSKHVPSTVVVLGHPRSFTHRLVLNLAYSICR